MAMTINNIFVEGATFSENVKHKTYNAFVEIYLIS